MTKRTSFILILILVMLAACGEEEASIPPTPFADGQTAVPVIVRSKPTELPLTELFEEPEAYQNQFLQLSGSYERLPLLICNSDPHPAPATWLLVAETGDNDPISVAVGGYDSQLHSLLDEGVMVTANGYWRYWEGAVGCGKQAVPRQIWYLRTTDIVSPPLFAQAVASDPSDPELDTRPPTDEDGANTPSPEGTLAIIEPTAEATIPPPALNETAVVVTNTVVATPIISATAEMQPPTPTDTVVSMPTIQATAVITITPEPEKTATGESQVTGTPGTPTMTPVATQSAQATPTSLPVTTGTPSPSPSPSAGGNNYTVVDADPINPDNGQFGLEILGVWQKQNWTISLNKSTVITIHVAADPAVDPIIAVFDETDNLIMEQNDAPAGQIETINSLVVNPTGIYIIQVYGANGNGGDYFVTIDSNESSGLVPASQELLAYGENSGGSIAEDNIHFWYFASEAGDTIDISTSATGDNTMLISLYDKSYDLVQDMNGDDIKWIDEVVKNVALPETGLYVISLEEGAYNQADYTISLSSR
ncbi:MAG: hypothetical protein GY796_12965 [Chloroflexi bacterium]|nr:hypothetical protein [Chloroflexota bacterium]